jgi:hypothetical protein
VTCTTLSSGRHRTIPVIVTIADINDNGPIFDGEPYEVTVPEVRIYRSSISIYIFTAIVIFHCNDLLHKVFFQL